ncbi:hypothetical protein BCR37DRAFT_379437 [Protomyces lactucae-debilis]|uniref:Uncharacterized protein n=1 Tax=Protomyces lactucae-debilis TaxID=2754530 RepID=A0A1Y2FI23_PROLT|nr:uncharacterized protein BCR37DRAFT_379437 [Protomyces lactucae-debilis]ORY82455.1 hypothetical protein BCR37DRAFT_379437 [Protomyces lactucae-debilis]
MEIYRRPMPQHSIFHCPHRDSNFGLTHTPVGLGRLSRCTTKALKRSDIGSVLHIPLHLRTTCAALTLVED